MLDEILKILLRPVTDLIHHVLEEIKMNTEQQTQILASLTQINADLDTLDGKVTDLTGTINKVGTETEMLLKEVADLQAALAVERATSPNVIAALAAVSARTASLAGHVAEATTAAAAVDAAVPDAVVTPPVVVPPVTPPVEPAPTTPPVEPPATTTP